MNLSKDEILKLLEKWLTAWGKYNLEGVMDLMHEEIVFDNWTGDKVSGKNDLQRSWVPWFINHGNFKFIEEEFFVDEQEQKVLFMWRLYWPSVERHFKGKPEVRQGVDVLHFKDGKIYRKYTYSKTTIQIDSMPITLSAQKTDFSE
jgi:hypothetical protein